MGSIMKTFTRCLTLTLLLLLTGCLATSYDAAMKREPIVIPPSVPEAKATLSPGSIWPGATSNNLLFTDRKARNIGDIVTIVVDEKAEGENNANTDTKRQTSTTAGITGFVRYDPDKRYVSGYSLGGASDSSLKGEGKTNRDGILKGKISARVVRVLPNGNLIIEGRRMLTVNSEDQFMVITGLIRPDDITSDNLINSQYISDARIVYAGKGVVDDKMRPGWMTRVVDWVWPF
jgi:flagellar L-ring protein precursor FlgH